VQDIPSWEPEHGYALMVDLIKYCGRKSCLEHDQHLHVRHLRGRGDARAGACVRSGVGQIRDRRGQGCRAGRGFVCGRLGFQVGVQSNFFEEIAKLRALRKMWAKVTRDAGCTNPKCLHARVHIHTSGNVLVAQQPLNNTARITMQIMAAVLGGVQSIHSCSYDETIGSHRLSHRTALSPSRS